MRNKDVVYIGYVKTKRAEYPYVGMSLDCYDRTMPLTGIKWSTFEAAFDEVQKFMDRKDIAEMWIEEKQIYRITGEI